MKNNKESIYLALALLCVWCPLFMGAWDKDKPSSSTSLRNSNPEILANWDALETAFAQDHEFSTGGTNSGNHEVLTMEEETSAGASSTNELHVQAIDGGAGQPEFAITSEDGDELQMTKDGDLFSSDGLTVTENATFNGGITLGAGDDLIGSATSDITFNTNKFTVAGATGNTLVAGTLDVAGNIDPTTYETTRGGFLDEDDMASDAADKVASQQSIKKNIGDQINATVGSTTFNPLSENGAAGSAGTTRLSNGFMIARGTQNVSAGAEDSISPTGFTKVYGATVSIIEDNNSDNFAPKVGNYSGANFTIRNTNANALNITWIAIGR